MRQETRNNTRQETRQEIDKARQDKTKTTTIT